VFSYAVKDHNSGDDFSHTQKQENGAVHGSYKVQLPDGRVQVVKYTANDVHGYRAEVSYEEAHVLETHVPIPTPAAHYQPKPHYPKLIKQVEVNNNNIRYTVTPTPYLSQYNIRAPQVQNFYPSTTSNPRHYFF
jgi:Insect cuticle protein